MLKTSRRAARRHLAVVTLASAAIALSACAPTDEADSGSDSGSETSEGAESEAPAADECTPDALETVADGTTDGFDLELIRTVRREVSVPVIASGGAGAVEHFPPAVAAGADAVLAATVFHFGTLTVAEVKAGLSTAGHPVR